MLDLDVSLQGLENKNALMLQALCELPDLSGAKDLFLDFEATSFDPKEEAFYPYLGHRIAGIGFTWDDNPSAYYIPIRHTDSSFNLPIENVIRWLLDSLDNVNRWINHNVKFDAHFATIEGRDLTGNYFIFNGEFVDTLTMAKMLDSDRFDFGLKPLCRDWLGLPMEEEVRIKGFLKGIKSKNYGDLPADLAAEYGCMDVLGNRELFKFMDKNLPPDVSNLFFGTEVPLTSVLYDTEREGMLIDPQEVKVETVKSLRVILETSEKISKLVGREYTDSAKCNFDILVNQCGLPVLSFNKDSGNPSFDADALALYKVHPQVTADPEMLELVELINTYRSETHFKGLFLDSYARLSDENNRLHPRYNQVVRTGRMSASGPNTQQLNKRAKRLIHPEEGEGFLSADADQIEFKIIVHYINDLDVIAAYVKDPRTDFHQWVADLCEIQRSPAKNINFAMGYGAGKKKVVSMLASNPDIMAEMGAIVNAMVESGELAPEYRARKYKELCMERATYIFHTYHERLPGIKRTSYAAMKAAQKRGYVFNLFGRRRHLPKNGAFKAFNSVVQGCAMDYIKDRMVKLAPRFNSQIREWGIRIGANVHDEVKFPGPIETIRKTSVQRFILNELQTQSVSFRLPFTWSMGLSEKDWAEAAGDETLRNSSGEFLAGKIPLELLEAA